MTATAKMIMTTPAVSVTERQTIKDVIELLAKNNFSGVPVVDDNNIVVGILSNTDIIRYSQQVSLIPLTDLSGWISPYTDVTDLAALRQGIDLITRTTAAEIMTRKVYTATEDTPVTELARLMSRRRINRVPIVDAAGKLIGIVTRADLVKSMAGE